MIISSFASNTLSPDTVISSLPNSLIASREEEYSEFSMKDDNTEGVSVLGLPCMAEQGPPVVLLASHPVTSAQHSGAERLTHLLPFHGHARVFSSLPRSGDGELVPPMTLPPETLRVAQSGVNGPHYDALLKGAKSCAADLTSLLAQGKGEAQQEGTHGLAVPLSEGLNHAQSPHRVTTPRWPMLPLSTEDGAPQGEALRKALGECFSLQRRHGIEHVRIRIDPPSLGSLEISMRHVAGTLSVQLVASHRDVVRQLQSISDALCQDLSTRQFAHVAVVIHEERPGGSHHSGYSREEQKKHTRASHRARRFSGLMVSQRIIE